MRIAYIAAGAGGMICGSCLHDNALAAALAGLGHEVVLLPTYTPLRTDEANVSASQVFYGGINVYLRHKSALFRHTPRVLDWLLDRPRLLRWVMRFSASTDARELGELTLSVLRGEAGPQAKELERLVAFLAAHRPDVVQITNSLLLGLVHRIRETLEVPVLVSLQGEDLFFEQLPPPYRDRVVAEMRRRAAEADGVVAPCRYYADHMGDILEVPSARRFVVPLGIRLDDYLALPDEVGSPRDPDEIRIGYLARQAPEKGLHLLVEAFERLASGPGGSRFRLEIAGYQDAKDADYLEGLRRLVATSGSSGQVTHRGEIDRQEKLRFLRRLDLFSVPTTYREPKGLFALEAMASGVPVVLPDHGGFPEMIRATGGGLLFEPGSATALAEALAALATDRDRRRTLGASGRSAVRTRYSDEVMARAQVRVYEEVLGRVGEG